MKNHRSFRFMLLGVLVALVALSCGIMIPRQQEARPDPELRQPAEPTTTRIPTLAVAAPTMAPITLPEVITNEEAVLIDLYKRVNPAVVNILTYVSEGGAIAPSGQGSGFLYDGQGHIVTNSHVVHGADAVDVSFADASVVRAEVVGEDLHSDLAVLRIERIPEGASPLPMADMNTVQVGQTVIAIGNPFGLGGTLTRGVVSALGRTIPALTAFSIPQAIQTDAPINPGNSGGPLLNLAGEVVGVNAQIETGDGSRSNSGVGFAIPVSIVSRVVPVLIERGEYEWGWLGVVGGTLNPVLVDAMNLPVDRGAYVAEVVQGGPADDAGLRGATDREVVEGRPVEIGGDVIIAVDGQPVNTFEDILIYLALNTNPGQEVTLTIVRNGESMDVPVTLEPRPNDERQLITP